MSPSSSSSSRLSRSDSLPDGISYLPADSPVSATGMLSRSRRRSHLESTAIMGKDGGRRTTTQARPSSSSLVSSPTPAQRLPSHIYGLTPSALNQPKRRLSQAKVRRSDRSERMAEDAETSTGPASRATFQVPQSRPSISSQRQPSASTPFRTAPRRSIHRPADEATPQTRGAVISGFLASSAKKRKSQDVSSSGNSSKRAGQGLFAQWGGGKEESPMDLLRRLAGAPGFIATPSDQGRDKNPSSILRLGSSERPTTKHGEGSRAHERATQAALSFARRSLTQRKSMANTSAATSELGQGRRQDYSRSNVFADLVGTEGDESNRTMLSATNPSRFGRPSVGRFTEPKLNPSPIAQEDSSRRGDATGQNDRERELERILAGETAGEGFALDDIDATGNTSARFAYDFEHGDTGRGRPSDGIFGGLASEGSSDNESFASAQEDVREESRRGSQASISLGFEAEEGDVPQSYDEPREIVGESVELGSEPDLDGEETEEDSTDSMSSSTDEEMRRRETAARMALLKKRTVRRQKERESAVTGERAAPMPAGLVHDLFRTMVTPSIGIGTATAPGKKRKQARIQMDANALEAVDEMTHHFFDQLSHTLTKKRKRRPTNWITEEDVLMLLRAQGHINPRMSLVSLGRKMLPREFSDLLSPELERQLPPMRNRDVNRAAAVPAPAMDEDEDEDDHSGVGGMSFLPNRKGARAHASRPAGVRSLAEAVHVSQAEQDAHNRRLEAKAKQLGLPVDVRQTWRPPLKATRQLPARQAARFSFSQSGSRASRLYEDVEEEESDDEDGSEGDETGEEEEAGTDDDEGERLESILGDQITESSGSSRSSEY